jgi:hypothetical protein
MVTGTAWVWDGIGFHPRPCDDIHLGDGIAIARADVPVPEPDLARITEAMSINPCARMVLAPDFVGMGWDQSWHWGMHIRDLRLCIAALARPISAETIVAVAVHALCHSVEEPLLHALAADPKADAALTAWVDRLADWPPPLGRSRPWWWDRAEERLAYSYERWHVGDTQPHGLALPRSVERIYRGIRSGKVCRKYMQ